MMAVDYARVILTEKNRIKHLLPWLCVQPARVEELRGEVDVHVTEKQQDVASLPEAGSDIQSLPPGKFSIQLDKGEVSEVGSSGRKVQRADGQGWPLITTLPRRTESPGKRRAGAVPL